MATGLQHARDVLGLQRVDLQAEFDSCHGSGELRMLHIRPWVLNAAATKRTHRRTRDKVRYQPDHLLQLSWR